MESFAIAASFGDQEAYGVGNRDEEPKGAVDEAPKDEAPKSKELEGRGKEVEGMGKEVEGKGKDKELSEPSKGIGTSVSGYAARDSQRP